jgi:hypothetical protein
MSRAAYNKAVASIFDAVLDERLTSAALEAIADYAGVSGASYLRVNKLTRQVSAVVRWGCFNGDRAKYLAYYSKIDPFRAIQEHAPSGTLLRLSEQLPQSLLRHDEWYNDYVLPGGVCDVLGSKLHESSSHIVLVGFHRAVGDVDRFPGDMEALQTLLDPLCNAARLNVSLIDIGYRSAIVNGEFELIAAGAIFTDGDGHIVETNRRAEHILRVGDGLTIRSGRICAGRSFETAAHSPDSEGGFSGPRRPICRLHIGLSRRRPARVRRQSGPARSGHSRQQPPDGDDPRVCPRRETRLRARAGRTLWPVARREPRCHRAGAWQTPQ